MKTIQQFGLVVLALVLGAAFVASPAQARKPSPIVPVLITYKLILPEIAPPEPTASGQWTLETASLPTTTVGVQVSCRRLTPGQQYAVRYWVRWHPMTWNSNWYGERCDTQIVTADAKGRLSDHFTVKVSDSDIVSVYGLWIENDAGEVVLEEQ